MAKKSALCVLSGGQDSTTAMFKAISDGYDVSAVTFAYNQKHAIEIACARFLTNKFKVPHRVVDISFYQGLVDSALTDVTKDINIINVDNNLPASFVPNRNQLFLTLAHSLAILEKHEAIYAGMCETDFSGYPDCRREFIDNLEQVLFLGSGTHIPIITPLMFLNKAQTFKMADDLGFLHDVIELSHTCYNGERNELHDWGYGCGTCPACKIRMNGFAAYKSSI